MDDVDSASSFYNNNTQIFENAKSSTGVETSVSLGNYSKYTLQSNNKYQVVSRVDNTVIYVDESDAYMSDIKDVLDDLGY